MSEPHLLLWNRIEPHPRSEDIEESLRAEIRDPLWMLSRQWQLGEFQGEDAGMAASVRLAYRKHAPDSIQYPGGGAIAYDSEQYPPEAKIESVDPALGLFSRAEIGRQWISLLEKNLASPLRERLIPAFRKSPLLAFKAPAGVTLQERVEHVGLLAEEEYLNMLSVLMQEEVIDGGALLDVITVDQLSLSAYVLGEKQVEVDLLGEQLLAWAQRIYQVKKGNNPYWSTARLAYNFEMATSDSAASPGLTTQDYSGGGLDWYQFDWKGADEISAATPGANEEQEITCYPSSVRYQGMPASRWWELEDSEVNFGQIQAGTANPAALLFTQFNLVYSNDWLTIPFQAEIGGLYEITRMVVTDNFGVQTLIQPIQEKAPNENWGLFQLGNRDQPATSARHSRLFVPPVTSDLQRSKPQEQIHFIRDEMANMVWAVEHIVPGLLGESRNGAEWAAVVADYLAQLGSELKPGPENKAIPRYQLASAVPEHWIPFVPVRVKGSNRQIQLQRASLPRIVEGAKPARVRPKTTLLSQGLGTAEKMPQLIHEEEIPRSGTIVKGVWKRARWIDGRTFVWYAYERSNGRGEGRSDLKYDQLIEE